MTDHPLKSPPSSLDKRKFLEIFGSIYENSPHYAERVWDSQPRAQLDTVEGLSAALKTVVDRASPDEKLALIRAHPDLAGCPGFLAGLSAHSQSEQTGAGLSAVSDEERAEFARLNSAYKEKFGFPFIVAVRGLSKDDILRQFRARLGHDRETEFATAMSEIHKIARLRLLNLS
jgi:2-oxo-4-hydroxy-4-carboxy-5-ureidoimidazoline decarboxylase